MRHLRAAAWAGRNQEMVQFTRGVYEAARGEPATGFLATGTAIRWLGDEHRLPATTPKPTFTLGLDA